MTRDKEKLKDLAEQLVENFNKVLTVLAEQDCTTSEVKQVIDLIHIASSQKVAWERKLPDDIWEQEELYWVALIGSEQVEIDISRHFTQVVWDSLTPIEKRQAVKEIAHRLLKEATDPR